MKALKEAQVHGLLHVMAAVQQKQLSDNCKFCRYVHE